MRREGFPALKAEVGPQAAADFRAEDQTVLGWSVGEGGAPADLPPVHSPWPSSVSSNRQHRLSAPF